PADAFRLPDVQGVAVVVNLAEGRKCARSWKISHVVGSDPQYPDVTPRDAQALREWETRGKAAERSPDCAAPAKSLGPAYGPRPDRRGGRLRPRSGVEAMAAQG